MRAPAGSWLAIHATCRSMTGSFRLAQLCSCDKWFSNMRWLNAGSSQGILLSSGDSFMGWEPEIIVLMSIALSLAVVQLGANVVQPAGIDAVRLAIDGLDQLFGFEFFEHGERAVAEQQPFTAVAFNGCIADVRNTSTFGENV
ncbi:hypothetical protein D3C75_867980 [compost metagenome]